MSSTRTSSDILVLCGGLSHERDISIRSGRRVAEALREHGFEVSVSDVDPGLLRRETEHPPACVVPMLHGAGGEDGSLADVLQTLQVPFVGSVADADRLSFDKPVAKAVARRRGIRTPDSVALPHALFRELGADTLLNRLVNRIGLPMVVKPSKGGSALGVAAVHEAAELPAAMVGAYAYGEEALLERYISGIEVSVGVIEEGGVPRALPAVEIVPDSGFYDYTARYTAGVTEFFTPARLAADQSSDAAELALAVHRELGLRDFSRVDMIIDEAGAWFIEVNVAPGMTETSIMPQAIEEDGSDLGKIFATLVTGAIERGN